ncbi:MAG: hypothetical protein H0T60_10605 [Acidobacteria bacterium]|nr:hypothetical protein [Acidobacteriota bacterium]
MKQSVRNNPRTPLFRHAALPSFVLFVLAFCSLNPVGSGAQDTPQQKDERGLGVKTEDKSKATPADQKKPGGGRPELVVQTGFGSTFGASKFVFSPDGRLLATASMGSSTVKLWEVSTGRELRSFAGKAAAVYSVPAIAFSRDGRLLAASGGENTIKVWEVETGREVQTLSEQTGGIFSSVGIALMAFSADGRALVSFGGAVKTWEVATGGVLHTMDMSVLGMEGLGAGAGASMGFGSGIALSPDGTQLAYIGMGGEKKVKVRFFDTASGRETRAATLDGVEGSAGLRMSFVNFAADGRVLVAGIDERKLKLWDAGAKGGPPQVLATLASDFSPVVFSPDGRLVVSWLENYQIKALGDRDGA